MNARRGNVTMKRLLLAAALLLCAHIGPSFALDCADPQFGYVPGPGGWYLKTDRSGPYSLDSTCTGILTSGQRTHLSPGQHNLAITTATALTPPAGATYAVVQAKTATVSYTLDGTTTPTSSVGSTLVAGGAIPLYGADMIAAFRAISATGTLDVEYMK